MERATMTDNIWERKNLVGGWTTQLKNMLVKMGSSSPRNRGENSKKYETLPPPRNYLRDHGFLKSWKLPAQRDGGLCGDERKKGKNSSLRNHQLMLEEILNPLFIYWTWKRLWNKGMFPI